MAHAALTIVLEKVTKLLTFNDNFISVAENELQQLKTEVNILLSFLEQAVKLPKNDELREGERQIMNVANAIEVTIDPSLSQALNRSRKRLSSLNQDVRSLRENTVKRMLDEAKRLFDKMLIGVERHISPDEIQEHPCTSQDDIVGFEDEKEKIIKCLLETSEEFYVISIIGMAGLGKTTLAWQIFCNSEIESEFPIRIWVGVSPVFKRKNALLKILSCFTSQDISSLSEQDLSKTVRSYMEENKFLLVIDDVWSIDVWNAIQDALPKTNLKSKVLVTSPDTSVGRHVNHAREPNHLRFMTRKESWELLKLQVFDRRSSCPEELTGIGSYVAKQCDGLPVAIRDIGEVLQQKLYSGTNMRDIMKEWNMVSENMSKFLQEMQQCRTLNVIASSYNRLPYELRDCFLYLGVFPENFEIPVWTLINLWIAEGLIRHKRGKSLEKTAEENLKDLIGRNLVMAVKTNHTGEVKTCRVHVGILVFCRCQAAITERNLFEEIKMSREGTFEPPISDVENYHRLCINSDLLKFLSAQPRSQNLRSLLCFYKKPVILDSKHISTIADAFSVLRVLATFSIKFTQFPEGVTRLIHLSYIALCGDDLEIPEAISQLWNLQTVVVDTKSLSLTIKANLWRMVLLKHVKTKAAITLEIQEREGNAGENLQTLSKLSPKSCTRGVFNRARNLKKLGIRGQLATLDAKCLRKLVRLEKLNLVNDLMFSKSASLNELHGLPHQALNSLPGNLKKLTLSATYLDWQHMSKLAKIGTLQALKLTNYAFTGVSWNSTGDPGFHRLEFLLISSTNLVFWEASTAQFPCLSCLVLKNCEKLNKIPKGLAKSLKKLDIQNLSKSAVESAREIEKENGSGFKLSIAPGCE